MNTIQPFNCLLIEHDAEDVEIFKMALDLLPYKVNCMVYSEFEGINVTIGDKDSMPTFIFYNPHMNNITGEIFLKNIKTSSAFERVPLIILLETTFSMQTTIVKSIAAQGYLKKENTIDGLALTLMNYLQIILRIRWLFKYRLRIIFFQYLHDRFYGIRNAVKQNSVFFLITL